MSSAVNLMMAVDVAQWYTCTSSVISKKGPIV